MTWTTIEPGVDHTKYFALRYNTQIKANLEQAHGYLEQPYTNTSGAALAIGDLVAQASDINVDVLAIVGSALPLMIATEAIADGATGYFARTGFALVNVTGTIVAGDYLQSSLTTKKAQKATNGQGIFGRARSSSATQVIAILGEVGGGLADHNHTAVGDGGAMTNPHIITAIKDANGNPILGLSPVASSVNYPFLVNAATGGVVELGVAGSDTDVNLALLSQAHGVVKLLTNGLQRFMADGNGNVVCGAGALATNATNGFLYVDSGAGPPTGTPTTYTGRVPIYVDTANGRVYVYIGGAWVFLSPSASGGLIDHSHTASGTDGGKLTSARFITDLRDTDGDVIVQVTGAASSTPGLAMGTAALTTSATDGFFYVTSSAGPPTGTPTTATGRVPVHVDSTNHRIYIYVGGAWVYTGVSGTGGGWANIFPFTAPPAAASGTWVNQGTSTATDDTSGTDNGLLLTAQGGSDSVRILLLGALSGDKTITAGFQFLHRGQNNTGFGLCFTDGNGATPKVQALNAFLDVNGKSLFQQNDYTNPTTYSATNNSDGRESTSILFIRMRDDGSATKYFYYSYDKANWNLIRSVSRTNFLTPAYYGIYGNSGGGSADVPVKLLSLEVA